MASEIELVYDAITGSIGKPGAATLVTDVFRGGFHNLGANSLYYIRITILNSHGPRWISMYSSIIRREAAVRFKTIVGK